MQIKVSFITIVMMLLSFNLSAQTHMIRRKTEVSAQSSRGQTNRIATNNSIKHNPKGQNGNKSKRIDSKSQNGRTLKPRSTNASEDELEKKYENMSMISLERYANQGDAMAQFYLGYKYAQNEDYKTAVVWFRKAAFNDLIRAQLWLSWCYFNGKGVDKDTYGAQEWLKEAASHGSADAKEYLRTWY